jgi:hypothetical protein
MVTSPYGFLRGSAIVMAADVARLAGDRDHSGDLRGRAHRQLRLLRLPERELVSTSTTSTRPTPGAGSGTCAGCVASIWVAGTPERRSRGRLRGRRCLVRGGLPRQLRELAEQPLLDGRSSRLDLDRLHETTTASWPRQIKRGRRART